MPQPDNPKITVTDGCLRLTLSGPFRFDMAKRAVDAIIKRGTQLDSARILVDCSLMTGDMSILDRYKVGKYSAEMIPQSVRLAVLGRKDQILPDKFFETVARNRGLTVAVFSDVDAAIRWLKE